MEADMAEATISHVLDTLISTIISHNDIHRVNMRRLHDLAVERGIRDGLILIAGGTQVNDAMAVECGMDAGFGRGTKGKHVASFIVGKMMDRERGQTG
jgi:D-ornithine 4,5-aminomutase subunit beta